MSDHALVLGVSIVFGVSGLLVLGLVLGGMLRECQRLTRAVAEMVYQESEKTRALITGRPQS